MRRLLRQSSAKKGGLPRGSQIWISLDHRPSLALTIWLVTVAADAIARDVVSTCGVQSGCKLMGRFQFHTIYEGTVVGEKSCNGWQSDQPGWGELGDSVVHCALDFIRNLRQIIGELK